MPRNALKLCVELTVSRVSCPGVWLRSNNEVYLSICLFGKYQRTTLCEPVFPVIVMEKFRFDKTFYTAIDPAEVSEFIEDEDILFEFVQLSPEEPDGAILLASFQRNVRDFLYPYPQLLPSYGASDREILMDKSWDFPGIAPRIEFGSHAKIKEVKVPKSLSRSLDHGYTKGRSSRSRARSPSPRSFVYPDSDEDYKGYQEPTVSSIVRSRSLSPSQRAKLDNKPQFLIRRTDESMIHRVPGSPTHNSKSKRRTRSARAASPVASSSLLRPCSKVSRSVLPDPYYSDEEADVEYTGATYRPRSVRSSYTYVPPPRPVSPILYRPSLRERYLAAEALEDEIRRRRILNAERTLNSSLGSRAFARSRLSYTDSIDDLADDFDRSRLVGY